MDHHHILQQGTLHVLDLPQLYTRPSRQLLLDTLRLLATPSYGFADSVSGTPPQHGKPRIDPEGVPRYLTSIIASSLSWLDSDDAREEIWNAASALLSVRSGRTAMPSMTRSFKINDDLIIELYEPSLTEDNLGLKTWTSSLLLARRLPYLQEHLPHPCTKILELGAGTGLVGIAAACQWHLHAVLTDLPEIVPNLQRNVQSNQRLGHENNASIVAEALDWSDEGVVPLHEDNRYPVILAADPIYSSDHPDMLVKTVQRWLARTFQARFIVELPLRTGFEAERADLRLRLEAASMVIVDEGKEIGFDDWLGADGKPTEVECWWSVWKRA